MRTLIITCVQTYIVFFIFLFKQYSFFTFASRATELIEGTYVICIHTVADTGWYTIIKGRTKSKKYIYKKKYMLSAKVLSANTKR